VGKQHFDLFTFVARALICLRRGDAPSHITSGFKDAASDLRNAVFKQHLAFIGQATQSVCRDRKMMVLALVTCERSFLKARHSLRNALPAGQRYSSASSFQWKSLLEKKLSFLRSVLSHTGTCGSMFFSSTIQASIGAVP
jgi:hypothetical protein